MDFGIGPLRPFLGISLYPEEAARRGKALAPYLDLILAVSLDESSHRVTHCGRIAASRFSL